MIVLNVPPCHALPPRLVIGADGQGAGVLGWLRKVATPPLERRALATSLLPSTLTRALPLPLPLLPLPLPLPLTLTLDPVLCLALFFHLPSPTSPSSGDA